MELALFVALLVLAIAGFAAVRFVLSVETAHHRLQRTVIEAARDVAIERARASAPPPQPQHYAPVITIHRSDSYAPSSSYAPHIRHAAPPAALLDAEAVPDTPAQQLPPPACAALLDAERIGRNHPLVLGFSDGGEVIGDWKDVYSAALAGASGSGKTTTARWLAIQTAMHGARFAVIDAHADAEDGLAATLAPLLPHVGLAAPASTGTDIRHVCEMVLAIGHARLDGTDASRTPVLLWIDELTALLNRSDASEVLAATLETVAQEFRKVRVYATLSGQIWTVNRTGGSALRDSLTSAIVHRMKPQQARLLVPSDVARHAATLHTGEAIWFRSSGEMVRVAVPNTTAGDVQRVAGLLADNQPTITLETATATNRQPTGNQPATTNAAPQSPETARTVQMFRDGVPIAEIARRLYGATTGRRYTDARNSVEATIRQFLGDTNQ